jgi:DNA-binding response OmpR family regulator
MIGSSMALNVLLVEDDPDIQRLLVDTMRGLGGDVTASARGVEALQLIKTVKPDLVVLDAMLPEVHGFEICRKIKESKRFGATPVLMISAIYRGWRIAEDIKATYKADAFLEKPFRISELRRVAEELLATGKSAAGAGDDLGAEVLARYAAGVEAYQAKDYRTALDELRAAEAAEPFSAKIQFMLGRTLEQDQKVFQAVYHYERAVELDPTLFAATKNLALLYQARGFRNKAVEMWERSLAAAPNPQVREQIKQYLVSVL